MQGTLSSELLLRVVTPGELFPDMRAALAEMQSVTDWAEAEATGRVEPAEVRRAAGGVVAGCIRALALFRRKGPCCSPLAAHSSASLSPTPASRVSQFTLQGVDAAYDAAVEGIRAAEQALKDYLQASGAHAALQCWGRGGRAGERSRSRWMQRS